MFRWELHTLDGEFLTRIKDRRDGEVRRTLNGPRTAKLAVSVYDDACAHIATGTRLLKCWYKGGLTPIFTGPLLMPEWRGQDGRVEIAAQDVSWRLDKAPLLLTTNRQYKSLDDIIEQARPASYGFTDPLIPDHGVAAYVPDEPGTWRKPMPILQISRGESSWALIVRCAKSVFGPDFDFRPIDQAPGSWDYCELDIFTRLGEERQDDPDLTFHYGWGKNNCIDASYRPGGDQLVNNFYSAFAMQGGEGGEGNERIVSYFDPVSMLQYGLVGAYESTGCEGSAGKGIATVAAYRQPPRFFSFQPAIEGYVYAGRADERFGVPPTLFEQFDMGDTLRVQARRGYFNEELDGRLVEIRLFERDEAGNVQSELTVVPRVSTVGIDAALHEEGV